MTCASDPSSPTLPATTRQGTPATLGLLSAVGGNQHVAGDDDGAVDKSGTMQNLRSELSAEFTVAVE